MRVRRMRRGFCGGENAKELEDYRAIGKDESWPIMNHDLDARGTRVRSSARERMPPGFWWRYSWWSATIMMGGLMAVSLLLSSSSSSSSLMMMVMMMLLLLMMFCSIISRDLQRTFLSAIGQSGWSSIRGHLRHTSKDTELDRRLQCLLADSSDSSHWLFFSFESTGLIIKDPLLKHGDLEQTFIIWSDFLCKQISMTSRGNKLGSGPRTNAANHKGNSGCTSNIIEARLVGSEVFHTPSLYFASVPHSEGGNILNKNWEQSQKIGPTVVVFGLESAMDGLQNVSMYPFRWGFSDTFSVVLLYSVLQMQNISTATWRYTTEFDANLLARNGQCLNASLDIFAIFTALKTI